MEGTGFLTMMPEPPARPFVGPEGPWLTEADLQTYADEFAHSGFFGPVSYYRNLDANFDVVKDLGPERLTMPVYFIGGTLDVVNVMDPSGIERMQNLLPDFRGADRARRRRPLDAARSPSSVQRRAAGVSATAVSTSSASGGAAC